ncbi:pyridoxamine 5'-phosphate oxidase family protein [Nocardia sp. NPDC049149]|uniref:pyridoxamine 5'-phosphate oxidase family protein n=1 Tax=Nocardia sp. NPDC049149 TaxID=3364315 RepID=UPI00371FAD4B
MDTTNLADLYSLPEMEWSAIRTRLDQNIDQAPGSGGLDRHTCWLTTINADGSPHPTAVGALWFDDAFWFVTGARSRKGRNLARDPRCTMSISTHEFDLVVAGEAVQITDSAIVADLAARWAASGWPARVDETGQAITAEYSAPSAGPPPWHTYRLTPRSAQAVSAVLPGGATRWRF